VPTHEDGSCLFWEFATDHYDIGFGLYFEWTIDTSNQVSVNVNESSDDEDEENSEWADVKICSHFCHLLKSNFDSFLQFAAFLLVYNLRVRCSHSIAMAVFIIDTYVKKSAYLMFPAVYRSVEQSEFVGNW